MGDAEVVAKHLAAVLRQKYADLHIIAHPGDINRWNSEAAVFSIIYKASKTCKKQINGALHLYMTSDTPQYFPVEDDRWSSIKGDLLLHDHLVEWDRHSQVVHPACASLPGPHSQPSIGTTKYLIARSDKLTNDSDFVCVDLVNPDSVTIVEDWVFCKLDAAYNVTT
jgi:hypothetical protein